MKQRELLKIILSLSSNYNQVVKTENIYKATSPKDNQSNIFNLASELHNQGLINIKPIESNRDDFRAELTSKGAVYLLSS